MSQTTAKRVAGLRPKKLLSSSARRPETILCLDYLHPLSLCSRDDTRVDGLVVLFEFTRDKYENENETCKLLCYLLCVAGVGASRVPLGLAPTALGFASMPLGLAMATFFFFVKLAPKRLYLFL